MELIRLHGLPIEAICGGACACATCHVHVAPEWAERLHPARDDEEAMLDTLPVTEPDLAAQLPADLGQASGRPGSHPGGEREAMKYFPLFADLDGAGVLVAGGGEQAAQKVRLLRKTNARITVVAETVTDELRGLAQQGAITIVPRAFRRRRSRWPAPRLCRHRRPRPRCGRLAGGAGARHSGQRGRRAGAVHLHHAGHRRPRSGDGRHRHGRRRAGAGARNQDQAGELAAGQSRRARRPRASAAFRCRRQHSRWPRAPPPLGAACCRDRSAAPS